MKPTIKKTIKKELSLLKEQSNYDCSNKLCSPSPPNLVNNHWRDYFSIAANGHQNSNFADYRYEHTGNISFCTSTSGPGNQWRWFDGIKLNPAGGNPSNAPIGPNPIQPNWASMVTYLQGQGVAVTLAMTGIQVRNAAIATLQTSGIVVSPQGACGNQPCPPPCGQVNEDSGCLDVNALNYNECCNGDPACTVIASNPECCRYDQGDHKGCMDSTAINYMTCCDLNIPGCVPTGSNPDCCEYDGDPDPCKLNPKDCWFCEPGDINTSGWVDPMALVNANGGCIQFLSTNGAFTSSYSGQMYPTQSDCNANSECAPTRGDEILCQCCKGGNPQSMSQSVPANPGCSVLNGGGYWNCQPAQSQPISCKKPLPDLPDIPIELAEEIKRYKTLL